MRWRGGPGDRRPREDDLAPSRLSAPGDEVERRRLARAVRADQADDLAWPNREADVVDRDEAAECLAAVPDREDRRARAACAAARPQARSARPPAVDQSGDAPRAGR